MLVFFTAETQRSRRNAEIFHLEMNDSEVGRTLNDLMELDEKHKSSSASLCDLCGFAVKISP
jgi:hypothetical protein